MTEYSAQGYESFFKNRLNKRGGSVICYVRNALPAMKINKQDSDKYDSVYIELETSKRNKLRCTDHRNNRQPTTQRCTRKAKP